MIIESIKQESTPVYVSGFDLKSSNFCKNWNFKIKKQFQKYNAQDSYQIAYPVKSSSTCSLIVNRVYEGFVEKWHGDLNRASSRRGSSGNKQTIDR